MKISKDVKRKIHYAAYNNGMLKAVKDFLKALVPKASKDIIEVIDECIEINEKLGNGYKLCKIDEAIKIMEELQRQEDMGIGYYNPPFYCERCIMILEAFIEGGKDE